MRAVIGRLLQAVTLAQTYPTKPIRCVRGTTEVLPNATGVSSFHSRDGRKTRSQFPDVPTIGER